MPGRIDGIYDRFVDTLAIHGFFFLCKESGTRNEVLIGQRIKAWSAFDSCFYSGTVDDFNPEKTTLTRRFNHQMSKTPCIHGNGLPEFLGNTNIGLKRMGELDPKAFHDTCKSRFPPDEAEIQATTLCLSWQENLKNLDWHPIFRRN
ncbi:hypothetical protein E1A91_A06G085200v1 [Gossypium mustelinum]|uniref:Factor of DNA methylation 1-5/IDN2 domain-containing protein n=1 Tax=Gossypium mustelinum TaxID=34275 RepID=A0A5D2YXG0_GOSMU|nr:hypothetical protein E1A91_A06G085200v1 [Gossypium mustelinum]